MKNDTIASHFELLADLLEIQGANPFRIRAYRNGARTISSTSESLDDMVRSEKDLTELTGIGKDLARQIIEIVTTGKHAALEELRKEIPGGVLDMLRIQGVGPKKVSVFFNELGLKSLDDLKAACEAGQLAKLKGFGKKTEQSILQNIDLAAKQGERVSIAEARAAAEAIVDDLKQLAGSRTGLSRGKLSASPGDLWRSGCAGDMFRSRPAHGSTGSSSAGRIRTATR